jgi:MFS family permease
MPARPGCPGAPDVPMLRAYLTLPRVVYILCLGTLVQRSGMLVLLFLSMYIGTELHYGIQFAALVMGAYGLGAAVGMLVAGQLADSLGRRGVMMAAMLGGAIVMLLLSQTIDRSWLVTLTFLMAAVVEMYRPAVSAMIADVVAVDRRAHAFGMMYIAINLGAAVGPVVGGLIIHYGSYPWLFYTNAAANAVYAVIIALCVPETRWQAVAWRTPSGEMGPAASVAPAAQAAEGSWPGRADADDAQARAGMHASAASQVAAPSRQADAATALPGDSRAGVQGEYTVAQAVRHILRDTVFLRFCAAVFLLAVVYVQAVTTCPLDLASRGFSPRAYGLIISINGLLIVLFQVVMTAIVARYDRGLMLSVAALLTGLGFGLNGVFFSGWHFVLGVVIWTLGEMIQAPVCVPVVSELAPPALRGRYMGVFGICFSGANMIGAPLGGLLLDACGPHVLWGSAFALSLVAAALYWSLRRHIAPADVRAPP